MRETKRKLLSLAMTFVMLLGMIPAMTLTAEAAEVDITENTSIGNISITEDTTFSISEDATYTVDSIRFENDATLTVTGGGRLQVNGDITSFLGDIIIIMDSSLLEAKSITAGDGPFGSTGSESDLDGRNGFNVSITASGNSALHLQDITGGNGGAAGSYEGLMGNSGRGGNVEIKMNGGFFQAAAICGGTGGGGSTLGDVNLTIKEGWLLADSIDGGSESTLSIDDGSVQITDINDIQPKSNGTDVYLTTVTVGSTVIDEEDVTYTVDGGSKIPSITDDEGKLYLWLPTGEHSIEVDFEGITYVGEVTTTDVGTCAVTLQRIAVKVTNGSTTALCATWAEAVGAVGEGGTITLLEDVVLTSSDVFPSVACTIDGGTDKHKLTLCSENTYLNADTTLKDLMLENTSNAYKYLWIRNVSSDIGYDLTIQGTVAIIGETIVLAGNVLSSHLQVDGVLNGVYIHEFQRMTIGASGEVNCPVIDGIINMENSGVISLTWFLMISEEGTLSGSGIITFLSYFDREQLQFCGSGVAPDCTITLKATGYTPQLGEVLVKNSNSSTGVPNIDKLTLGEGFEQFALSGAVNGEDYNYTLKYARTITLDNKTVPYGSNTQICDATVTRPLEAGETVVYTFYPTADDRTAGTNGTTAVPQNVGNYYIRATIAESTACVGASADASLTITKDIGSGAPTEVSMDDDANTFEFLPVSDLSLYEYSIDGGTLWRTVTVNPISVGNIAGSVKVRLKETENYEAGSILTSSSEFTATLEGSVSITGTPEYGKTLTAEVTGAQSNAVLSYQWKRGTTDIGTNSTYTLSENDIGETITVTVTAAGYIGSLTSAPSATVTKADQTSPQSAITTESIGTDRITLNAISGGEYSMDGVSWQDSPTFTGLSAATEYTLYVRFKETNTEFASAYRFTWKHTRAEAPTASAATIDFINETISFDSTYAMNTAEDFTGMAIQIGTDISDYTGQTLYIRTNGAFESEATAVSIPARPSAPTISSVSKNLVVLNVYNATVEVAESGTFVYRVNNSPWQTSNVFSRLEFGKDYTFEAAYAATASAFRSESASQAKKWDLSDFTAPEIAALITNIIPPAKDAKSLTLPLLPDGFTAKIKSVSQDTTVLSTNGSITPPKAETTVKVILTVSKKGESLTGDTAEILVTIPAKTASHSGGGSSSGGSSTETAPITNTSVTPSSGTNTPTATATVKMGEDGTATASVTKEQIASAVAAAVEEGKKMGTNKTAVEIVVHTVDSVPGVSLTIPQAAFETIASSADRTLTISSPVVTIVFDETALSEIHQKTNGDIKIMAASLDKSTLSNEEKAKIGDRPVYDLTVTSGNTTISSFGGGTATVSIPYTLTADEDPNKIVVYYISDSGELVMVPDCVYNAKTGRITFKTKHFSTYAVGYNNVSFSDVSGWSEPYINYLASREIINGTGNGNFSPNANITRAQVVAILARQSGTDLRGYTTPTFTDVATTDWYFAVVQWAHENSVASGHDGKFEPDANITREQMAVMLYNYAKYAGVDVSNADGMKMQELTDYESISNWATTAISWAMNAGIVSGNADGSFAPADSATREAAAKMIAQLQQGAVNKA